MGEIIRDWLRTRLGVIIDLSPEIFGHYARDGTLLAKVLHSYDVINDSQLSTLLQTQDPALARVNLKHLRVWLRFVGVDCDTDCIEDISNGKGTMSLRLFYKVFLCLENKDRLHFITLQKEREKYIPSSSKFDVTTVTEEPEEQQSSDHPYADSLRKNLSLVDWQKKKYKELMDGCKKNREKFRASQEENEGGKTSSAGREKKSLTTGSRRVKSLKEGAQRRELDEFARRHRVKSPKLPADPCEDIVRHSPRRSKTPKIDHEAARAYTKSLKSKHHQEALTKSFKTRMQKNLLTEIWKKVLDDQEMEFDEIVAKKVLHQSQYEKQLIRKLCDVRGQKARMAGNRAIVEELLEKTRENEMRLDQERAREVMVRESEEVEAERRRINELERRIEEQSRLRRNEKLVGFGEKVVRDLVDISIKAGEYKIVSNEDHVPRTLWNQWKALFYKSQPIIDAENEIIPTEDLEDQEVCDEIEKEDETRTQLLNEEDFENYINMKLPWKDFIPSVDDQTHEYLNLGLAVLGYIVHKTLLEGLYPDHQMESVVSPLPVMKTRAVVLGVPDSLLYEPIQELLKNSKIQLVRIEEAINHCLRRYKAEMKDFEYIDLDIIAATREIRNSSSISSETGLRGKKVKKSPSIKPKISSSLKKIESEKNGVDKVTQTPRVIPYEDMDPSLSDAAYIGKWIHEFLTLGQPLSDELISRVIVEYLKSLEDIQGFVLVNYPNTYRQMNSLEFALSGRRLPDNNDKFLNASENTNIEEIDSIPSRIIFDDEEDNDSEVLWSESRLVPNPAKPRYTDGNSYLTAFIRIKPNPRDSEQKEEDDDIWEILTDDATPVDTFYVDQDIASILYYTIFDLSCLKRLVRLVIAGKNELLARASSEELFGEYLDYFEGRRDDDYSAVNAPIVKKLLRSRTMSNYSFGESEISMSIESREGIAVGKSVVGRSKDDPVLPGEAEWSWANLSQPFKFLQSLANIWQNLETCYVENLKQVFHLKRMNFGEILPYKDFVTRHMREIIDRPDKKQDLLHEFHCAFNDIDQDIRDELEIKRELHCRIDDFQTKLWEICDSRRRDAEDERKRIISDHWTTVEMINIANIYIDILQAEIDRCSGTLQFIQDYYTSMLQRPLQEIRPIVSLKKILLKPRTSDSKRETLSSVNGSAKSAKRKESKEERVKSSISKIPQAPSAPNENLFEEELTKLLTDVDEENFDPAQTLCYKAIEANIHYIQSIVDSLASRILDYLKKEETSSSKSPIEFRDKKGSSRKVSRSSKIEQESEKKLAQNVILEWRYAFMFEINRIRVRLKILDAAARSDINYLIDGMRRVFSGIKKYLIERYNREIKSVNEMASTFRFAVEEARPIQEEMLLDADRFLVRSNVLMFPDRPDIPNFSIREEILPSRFTISQLENLVNIFRRSAPSGILSERSFVYILEDLIVCDDEKGENSPLPSAWYELRACDVTKLVDDLFGDAELVDWREFIIYAMDIEMPSVDEILDDFRAFGKIDDKSEEFVSRDEFFSIGLWFFDGNMSEEDLLSFGSYKNFVPNEKEISAKCYGNSLTKRKSSSSIGRVGVKPEDTLRLALMKKLLCEMFLSSCKRVNYVALLMAFCKDEKPEIGLGKALSLAIGNKICMNWEDGEEYVRERLEDKRRAAETRSNGNDLCKEATKVSEEILNRLLKQVFQTSERKIEDTVKKSIDTGDLLPTEDKTWISGLSKDTVRDDTPEERKNRGLSVKISLPEKNEMIKRSRTEERPMVYWLHFDVSQSILAAMLPSHATQPNILESGKSLRENLKLVYLELRDEEINDEPGVMVLAHRFIHHDFVKKLLTDTSKFTIKYLGNTIDKNKSR